MHTVDTEKSRLYRTAVFTSITSGLPDQTLLKEHAEGS